MDSEKIQSLQNEVLKIKKGLKDWESTFFKSHQRKPTIKDIQERPKVERVYKDYNKKKKQLRQLSADLVESESLSQPVLYDTQSQDSAPSPSQKRRGSSVEYIRSPSHRLSRIKYVDNLEQPTTTLDFATTSSTTTKTKATDEDSFWLGTPTSSQDTLFLKDTTKRRKKKNSALEQRLFGHLIWKPRDTLSPALKAERDDPQTTSIINDDDDVVPEPLTADDLTVDGLIITERQLDPFRHFDPTLIHQIEHDPDCFVMPGLFASSRARSTIMAPMMKDDMDRHNRIMEAIRSGTLGEKRQEDTVEDDENVKQFMEENTDSLAETTDEPVPHYRKKFTQKRQTKLHKFRYVETAPSSL